jgi:hypothetical protein
LFGFVTETPFTTQLDGITTPSAFEHSRPTRISLPDNAGKLLKDGDTLVLQRPDQRVVLEFDHRPLNPGVIDGHLPVEFEAAITSRELGEKIISQLESADPPFHASIKPDGSLALDLELDPISFLYIGILALLANLSVGTIVSYLLSRGKPAAGGGAAEYVEPRKDAGEGD